MDSSSRLRSDNKDCARAGLFHKSASAVKELISSRRLRALSQSKMPPQQCEGLLDVINNGLQFCFHIFPCLEYAADAGDIVIFFFGLADFR